MNKTEIKRICKFINSKKTYCLNNHLLPKKKNGRRLCLICSRITQNKSHAKKAKEIKKPKSKFDIFN